ncbi:MAG: response regulator transcription factor [Cellulomonas sp.]
MKPTAFHQGQLQGSDPDVGLTSAAPLTRLTTSLSAHPPDRAAASGSTARAAQGPGADADRTRTLSGQSFFARSVESVRASHAPTCLAPALISTEGVVTSAGSERGLIMVIEDEAAIADIMRLNLVKAGYGVHVERDGTTGLAAIRALKPAAAIVDIGLPGLDGIEVCRRLRAMNDWTPVLFVTARDDEVDRIVGLELGADDYVTKPFSPRELVARVTSVLRRSQGGPDDVTSLVVGAVRLDPAERRVYCDGSEVELTATEFELLGYLMRRPGRVFSREQLISDVWGYSAAGGVRTVDVHIAQVRAKLGSASPIRTVRGVGYAVDSTASRGAGPAVGPR